MTITSNADCTLWTVTDSTLLDQYQADGEGDPTDYTLTFIIYKLNCEDVEYTQVVEWASITGAETPYSYEFDPTIIDADATEFADGVYSVKFLLDDDGTITPEVGCHLVKCDLECRVFDYQSEHMDSNIFLYYQALQLGPSCDQCDCQGMCDLLTKIEDILASTPSNDCGCQ